MSRVRRGVVGLVAAVVVVPGLLGGCAVDAAACERQLMGAVDGVAGVASASVNCRRDLSGSREVWDVTIDAVDEWEAAETIEAFLRALAEDPDVPGEFSAPQSFYGVDGAYYNAGLVVPSLSDRDSAFHVDFLRDRWGIEP